MTQGFKQEDLIIKKIRQLSSEKQQELLDFVEKLLENQDEQKIISAYDIAKDFAGCVNFGPGDLSTNKDYLKSLGKK